MLPEFSSKFPELRQKLVKPFVININPNVISVIALIVAIVAGYLFWQGFLFLAAVFVLLNGFLDILDGEIAKTFKRESKFGDFIDHSFDRIADVAILLGLTLNKSVPDFLGFATIILVLLAIVIFVTFAFRKVSEPVASWKYGLITIFALSHDVLVPTGVFAILGHFEGYEVDTLFVTALLVILGFSVHDTIVVFDRVRENLRIARSAGVKKTFEEIVGESINQTFIRSVNTSLTTLIALVVLYFIGPEITKHFSLALIVGITVGTYSSIFLGSPLLVTVEKWQNRKR